MKKLRYTEDCERRCKYGKLTKDCVIEVSDDDYQHFVSLCYFEPVVEVIAAKTKPKPYRMIQSFKKVEKMVIGTDFEKEKE